MPLLAKNNAHDRSPDLDMNCPRWRPACHDSVGRIRRFTPGMILSTYYHTSSMTKGKMMQRITITLDDDLMDELDQMILEQGYQNRAEAIRDFTRAGMQQASQKMGRSQSCVAALVYVYDHA